MPATAILGILIAASALEGGLLLKIFSHPAGGWEPDPQVAFLTIGLIAAVPILIVTFILIRGPFRLGGPVAATGSSITVAIVGPIFLWLALHEYGHATLLFILLGILIQLIAAIQCWRTQRRAI